MKKIKSIKPYIKRNFNFFALKELFISIKGFVIEFFRLEKPFQIFKRRKNGISVLLPTQNEEYMVELSIKSFLDFGDEIIVVDNGSIDKTKEIVTKLAEEYPKIKFYNKPELPDLYHNRQFALKKSKYRWICRFDSDYVAYTDGENDIKKLRKLLLNTPKGIIPKVFLISRLNIDGDFWHVRTINMFNAKKQIIISDPEKRIYEYFPFFVFSRFGRRENVSFHNFMKNILIKKIFWMHCNIKSELNYFLRSERSIWRASGDFKKYPTLKSYIRNVIKEKYNTSNFKKAMKIFSKNVIYNKNHYIPYDPKRYLPYPKLIQETMEKENVFKIIDSF